MHNGTPFEFIIRDTFSSSHITERLNCVQFQLARAIIMCFDLSDRASFEELNNKWNDGTYPCETIMKIPEPTPMHPLHWANKGVPLILCGLKCDLPSKVTKYEAEEMAKNFGAVCYMECSSKTRTGVVEVFEKAAQLAADYQPPKRFEKKPKKKKCAIM